MAVVLVQNFSCPEKEHLVEKQITLYQRNSVLQSCALCPYHDEDCLLKGYFEQEPRVEQNKVTTHLHSSDVSSLWMYVRCYYSLPLKIQNFISFTKRMEQEPTSSSLNGEIKQLNNK